MISCFRKANKQNISTIFKEMIMFNGINDKVLQKGDPEPGKLESGNIRIYGMRFCPFSQRDLIYAAKKKIPIEVINIHVKNKPDWMSEKHPKGQIPVLEHDGKHVTDSTLIAEYLDESFPDSRILPTDPYEKVQHKLMFERLSPIVPLMHGLINSVSDPTKKEEELEKLEKAFGDAEKLLPNEFFAGQLPGFADYLIYPNFQRIFWLAHILSDFPLDATHFPGNEKYPKLTKWYKKMEMMPEIAEVSQPKEIGVKFFMTEIAGHPNFDIGL